MLSLYHSLLAQHARQLRPVCCAEQTIIQLHRYFEDVVLENNLAALVVEGLPFASERSLRELTRVRAVGRAARHCFFFLAPDDALHRLPLREHEYDREPVLIKRSRHEEMEERFIIIADARFSGLLASVRSGRDEDREAGDQVIWTFEPDIVYSALEYLMARVSAERPFQAPLFATAVRSCVPKATSLQLTVAVTTKLARLLQEQAGREIAINRIATAIRRSLELDSVLQTTVDEVGRALGAHRCALRVEGEHGEPALAKFYFRPGDRAEADEIALHSDLCAYCARLSSNLQNYVVDGRSKDEAADHALRPLAVVPLIYGERLMGALMVQSDDPSRVWQESELLLLNTVADQVAVAVNHARLFEMVQKQALTDGLTGCFNRRSFEMQLERDMSLAMRMRQPVSLVLLDLDHFKRINDTFGHAAGDLVLRTLAGVLREELRDTDTAARYGGEEFALILPQADFEGAVVVAERLRKHIEGLELPSVGQVTASFGVATFPQHAASREKLIEIADQALYAAKKEGRNRVGVPSHSRLETTEDPFDDLEESISPAETNRPSMQPNR